MDTGDCRELRLVQPERVALLSFLPGTNSPGYIARPGKLRVEPDDRAIFESDTGAVYMVTTAAMALVWLKRLEHDHPGSVQWIEPPRRATA